MSAKPNGPANGTPVLQRRLELAAGGIPIGITNRAGRRGDKCAHYEAMPGGPNDKYPDRPRGPGPKGRGAFYYATTDANTIENWTRKYPDCNTFIGGLLPKDVACLDIDRFEDFKESCPGLFERLLSAGHPTDKRIGKDRWHIWFRMPVGLSAKQLPGYCSWGEVKRRGGLVVSSPSKTYEPIRSLDSWENVPRISDTDVQLITDSKASRHTPSGASTLSHYGRHPEYCRISARMAAQFYSRDFILDAIIQTDLESSDPAQFDTSRHGDFFAEIERMVDGAITKFGTGIFTADVALAPSRPPALKKTDRLPNDLFTTGGLIESVASHINAQATVKNPELALWGGIVAVAHATGRHIETESGLSPSIGIILLAGSATGKEKPQSILGDIFHTIGLGKTLVRKIASGQGIEDRLEKEPKLLLMVDEVMHLFRSMADPRQASFSPESILKELISGKIHYTGRVAAKIKGKFHEPIHVIRPHVTFYGSAVPSEFFSSITEHMTHGGLFGRLICPVVGAGELVSPAPKAMPIPGPILKQFEAWAIMDTFENDENGNHEPRVIQFEANASRIWEDFRISCHKRSMKAEGAVAPSLWGRAAEKAGRLSLIAAASREGTQVETISEQDTLWALRIVEFYTYQLIERASLSISSNETERRRNKFLAVMKKYFEKNPNEVEVPHSYVIRYTKLNSQECNLTASDLSECEDIQIRRKEPSSNGRRAVMYSFATPDSQIHAENHPSVVNQDLAPKPEKEAGEEGRL